MKLEKYFNEKGGIFTALAVFISFSVISSNLASENFLSLAGFFISFLLIAYLLNEMDKIDKLNVWGWLLFIGYNLLFVSLFLYGFTKFHGMFNGSSLKTITGIIVLFYGYISIKSLIKQIKSYFK